MGASSARDFAAGQVWTYHVKPGDEGSTLQINKVEQDPKLGPIFHISVFGLRISNPRVAGGVLTELPHLPVSKETLDKSVESLSHAPVRPVAYERGICSLEAGEFDAGRAGIYAMSVAEMKRSPSPSRPCQSRRSMTSHVLDQGRAKLSQPSQRRGEHLYVRQAVGSPATTLAIHSSSLIRPCCRARTASCGRSTSCI